MAEIKEADERTGKRFKLRLIDIAIILQGVLCGFVFFTHWLWLVIPIFILLIFICSQKANSEEDEERRESLSNQSFAFGLLIPVFAIMGLFVWLVMKLIPVIIQNWK